MELIDTSCNNHRLIQVNEILAILHFEDEENEAQRNKMVGLRSQAKMETEIYSNPDVWSLRTKLLLPQLKVMEVMSTAK
jgi:hypothetical protein